MQRQLLKQPSILNQLIVVCGLGLLLGITSIWLPPYFVLVGIGGVIYLIVAWSWPEIALLSILLFTSTVFNIYTFPSIPIGIGHLVISDILLFALIGIILLRGMVKSSSYFIHTSLDMPLLAFYGTAILATAIGIFNSRVTFNQSLGEVRIVSLYLTFFIVTNLVRNEKQVRRLLNGIFLLAFFVALMMIVQYLLGNSIIIIKTARVETLETAGVIESGVTRILPPGQSLVVVVFISQVVLLIFDRTPSSYLSRFFLAGATGLAVLLTFTRGYWVAVILALFFVGLLVSIRDKVKYVKIVFWTVLIGAFILTPFLDVKGSQVGKLIDGAMVRMSTMFNPDITKEESLTYRYIENEYVFPQIVSHPFFGLGLGANYRPRDPRLDFSKSLASSLTWYIHNGYYWVMVKIGLIGFLFFMYFFLRFVKRGFQNWKRISDPFLKGIVLSFAVTILSLQFTVFTSPIFTTTWWAPIIGIMLGTSEVILRICRDPLLDVQTLEKLV